MPDFGRVVRVLYDGIDAYVGRMRWPDRPDATLREKYALLGRLLPDQDDVERALSIAYEATFTREEGRWTRFVLEVVGDTSRRDNVPPDVIFAPPYALTADTLRALSPAHDVARNALLLEVSPGPALLGIRTFATDLDNSGSEAFTIEGLDPGTLRIGWLGYRFLRVERDDLVTLAPGEWTVEEDVAPLASNLLGASTVDLSQTLGYLLRSIREQGHGGALWLLPEGAALPPHLTVDVPVEDLGPPSRLPRHARRAWAWSVGRMSAVDGAILLDARGRLLGFGTFMHTEPDEWVLHVQAGGSQVVRGADVGGGRHRAAMAFCCSTTPAAAVVVSEDGLVSFMGQEAHGAAIWGRPVGGGTAPMPFYGRLSDLGRVGVRRL